MLQAHAPGSALATVESVLDAYGHACPGLGELQVLVELLDAEPGLVALPAKPGRAVHRAASRQVVFTFHANGDMLACCLPRWLSPCQDDAVDALRLALGDALRAVAALPA